MGVCPVRRGGRVVEGAPLLRAYGSKAHRVFQSLPLRHTANQFSSLSLSLLWQRRSGDNARRAAPKGRGAQRRVIPPSPPLKNLRKIRNLRNNWDQWKETGCFLLPAYCQLCRDSGSFV